MLDLNVVNKFSGDCKPSLSNLSINARTNCMKTNFHWPTSVPLQVNLMRLLEQFVGLVLCKMITIRVVDLEKHGGNVVYVPKHYFKS